MNAPEKFLASATPQPAAGQSHFHESARAQVAGAATYIDDIPEVKGTLHAADGRTVLDAGGLQMSLPGVAAQALAARNPGEVTVGIRPEHLMLAPANVGDLTARIELIEPVGPVTYLDVMTGDRALRASVPGNRRYEIGATVGLTVAPESLHFFDAAGKRIAA